MPEAGSGAAPRVVLVTGRVDSAAPLDTMLGEIGCDLDPATIEVDATTASLLDTHFALDRRGPRTWLVAERDREGDEESGGNPDRRSGGQEREAHGEQESPFAFPVSLRRIQDRRRGCATPSDHCRDRKALPFRPRR